MERMALAGDVVAQRLEEPTEEGLSPTAGDHRKAGLQGDGGLGELLALADGGHLGSAWVGDSDLLVIEADESLRAVADSQALDQVLTNLVDNAVKFTGDQSEPLVEIGARQDGAETVIYVRDNGVGIPEDKLPYIFEPFFSMKGKFGTGLGLSITYDLVQRMGGRINIDSKLGEGTSVIVELPASAAQ